MRGNWFCFWVTVLLAIAVPVPSIAASPTVTTHTSSKSKKTHRSSRRRPRRTTRRRRTRRARGQARPTAARIREIQSALNREGALAEEPTGRWDAATVQAMTKFQADKGLDATGKIDALTLQKLGLGSGIAGKAAPAPIASSDSPASPAE
jgi:peptidoglycan hydrolase-like protein with peptidoglycan-binding domain